MTRIFIQLPDRYEWKGLVVNVFRNTQDGTRWQYFSSGQSAEVPPGGAYLTNEWGWLVGTLDAEEVENLIHA